MAYYAVDSKRQGLRSTGNVQRGREGWTDRMVVSSSG